MRRLHLFFTPRLAPCRAEEMMKTFLKTAAWSVLAVVLAVVLIVAALFAVGVLWREEQLAAPRTAGPLAITGVAVVDVRAGRVVASQTVLVENGRIRAVGHAASLT